MDCVGEYPPTDRSMAGGTDRPTYGRRDRPTNLRPEGPTNRPTYGRRDRPTNRWPEGPTDRPTDGRRYRPTDLQSERPTDGRHHRPIIGSRPTEDTSGTPFPDRLNPEVRWPTYGRLADQWRGRHHSTGYRLWVGRLLQPPYSCQTLSALTRTCGTAT